MKKLAPSVFIQNITLTTSRFVFFYNAYHMILACIVTVLVIYALGPP
jgi:hypothetical protein